MVLDELKLYDSYIIYGAQVIAYGAYKAIAELSGRKPLCFAVGKPQGLTKFPTENPDEIEGIRVKPIESVSKETFIIVAVTELVQREVLPYLKEHGYEHVFPLTQHEEHLLMSTYYRKIEMFPEVQAEGSKQKNVTDFKIYEVMNDRDKPLSYHPDLYSYEQPIQAGAALAEKMIADVKDNTGINISEKNRMYCEMSAVYWVWKNAKHDWVGIEHYRRHLLIKPEMLTDDIDVILPLPYICYPNEVAQFRRFISEDVLNALIKALKDLHPAEFEEYRSILYGQYQYTYNMQCSRWDVFDRYCSWFFEITEYMETMSDKVPEIKTTRALSYVAEVLTNIYFMSHQKELRIRHVEKEIYT